MLMKCPERSDGVHEIDANNQCKCGYKLVVPPVSVDFSVYNRNKLLIGDAFNCESVAAAAEALRDAADQLERL